MNCWELFDAATSVDAQTRILIWGPKGLAKSRYSQMVLKKKHKQIAQVSLNDDIAVQELQGHYVPKGNEFVWHNGPVLEAYKQGYGLVVNELSRASGAVQDMFLSILDDPEVSLITLPNGEHLRPGKGFQVIATSNHDPDQMDEALVDRFDTIIRVDVPHPHLIRHLNDRLDKLGDVVRDSYKDPKRAISPRRALAYLTFVERGVAAEIACRLAFPDRFADIWMALKPLAKEAVRA